MRHTDFMGKKITQDSHVIYSSNNELTMGKILYCPATTSTGKIRKPVRKYPKEVVVVGGKELTWWALTKV